MHFIYLFINNYLNAFICGRHCFCRRSACGERTCACRSSCGRRTSGGLCWAMSSSSARRTNGKVSHPADTLHWGRLGHEWLTAPFPQVTPSAGRRTTCTPFARSTTRYRSYGTAPSLICKHPTTTGPRSVLWPVLTILVVFSHSTTRTRPRTTAHAWRRSPPIHRRGGRTTSASTDHSLGSSRTRSSRSPSPCPCRQTSAHCTAKVPAWPPSPTSPPTASAHSPGYSYLVQLPLC